MMDKFQDHFNDAEIMKLEIGPDIERWEQILEFNEKEIEFLINFLSDQKEEQNKVLLQKMKAAGETNQQHHRTFLDFKNDLENHRECDELDCDTHYVKQYFALKEILLKYFQAFRDEKNAVYAYFKEGK